MRAAIAVVCVSGVLVAACVSVNRSVLSRSRIGQPVPREQVRVIVDGDSVPPHETIAILSVQGDRNVTNDARLIEKLREEAGKLGANAILLGSLQDVSTAAVIAQVLIGRPANRKGQAIAIYVAAFDRK